MRTVLEWCSQFEDTALASNLGTFLLLLVSGLRHCLRVTIITIIIVIIFHVTLDAPCCPGWSHCQRWLFLFPLLLPLLAEVLCKCCRTLHAWSQMGRLLMKSIRQRLGLGLQVITAQPVNTGQGASQMDRGGVLWLARLARIPFQWASLEPAGQSREGLARDGCLAEAWRACSLLVSVGPAGRITIQGGCTLWIQSTVTGSFWAISQDGCFTAIKRQLTGWLRWTESCGEQFSAQINVFGALHLRFNITGGVSRVPGWGALARFPGWAKWQHLEIPCHALCWAPIKGRCDQGTSLGWPHFALVWPDSNRLSQLHAASNCWTLLSFAVCWFSHYCLVLIPSSLLICLCPQAICR